MVLVADAKCAKPMKKKGKLIDIKSFRNIISKSHQNKSEDSSESEA